MKEKIRMKTRILSLFLPVLLSALPYIGIPNIGNYGNYTESKNEFPEQIRQESLEKKEVPFLRRETERKEIKERVEKAEIEESEIEKVFSRRAYEKLKQFGYEFFERKVIVPFTAPVSKDYILGPGDQLFLYIIGAPPGLEISRVNSVMVDKEGKIYIPGIGVFYVWGMTLKDAEKIISSSINANIKLSVGRLRTFPVYVSGEVKYPGPVNVTGLNTVVDAICLAGGIKKTGSLRNVLLVRKVGRKTKKIKIDFYELLLRGKPVNIRLRDGDVIFVNPIGKVVGISGNVKRPGIYELKNEKTVEDVIKLAGGLLPSSYKPVALIQRFERGKNLKVISGSLNDKEFLKRNIKDGDLIVVRQISLIPQNAIEIRGYTPYPGVYAYKEGMKLSDILKPELFYPDTNMKFGVVERIYPIGNLPKYLTFSPENVLKGKEDLVLKPLDRIYLYKFGDTKSVDLNKIKNAIVIEGKVKYPGVYAYKEGMKLSDILKPELFLLNTNLYVAEIERRNLKTLEIDKIIRFSPINVLKGKEDVLLKPLDIIRFFPKYAFPPIEVSGSVKKPYYVPYREGIKLSEVLANVEFTQDVKNLKAVIYRNWQEGYVGLFEKEKEKEKEKEALYFQRNVQENQNIQENNYKDRQQTVLVPTKERAYRISKKETAKDFYFRKFLNEERISNRYGEKFQRESFGNFTYGNYTGEEEKFVKFGKTEAKVVLLFQLLVKGNEESDVELKPGDKVVIVPVRENEIVEKVYVGGRVKKPGFIKLEEGMTLYDALKRAGGFLEDAYPEGIVILRESVRKLQKEKLTRAIAILKQQLEKERAGIMQAELSAEAVKARQIAYEAKEKLLEEMEKAQVTGRISGIRIPKNLEILKNSPLNIKLEDGDFIYVPKRPDSVLVFGEVFNPTAYVYKRGLKVKDYIALAGGLTESADKANIYVIKADGSVVSSKGSKLIEWNNVEKRFIWGGSRSKVMDYKLEPGDAIIVPTKVKVPIMWRPLIKDVIQIIYQSALTVYTITKL